METSESISKIVIAICKMQGQLQGAEKGASNPFHKSKYANLESVWDACRKPLSENGLAVIQSPSFTEGRMILTTRLCHTSGEWFQSYLSLRPKEDTPQAIGSTITYAKRYSLMGMVGIADTDDDDGNVASGKVVQRERPAAITENSVFDGKNESMSKWLWKIFDKHKVADRGVRVKLASEAQKQKVQLKDLSAFIAKTLEHGNE